MARRALAARLAGLGLAGALVACSSTPRLVVGCDLSNKPFAFLDEHGVESGRDVEMMAELGRRIGREIVWERLPFEELLPAVQDGRVDVVCATLGITPERAEWVSFSESYFRTGILAVVRDEPRAPATLADLAGRRVAASPGTTSERAVRLAAPQALLVDVSKSDGDHASRLASGLVDAVVLDGPDALRLVQAGGGLRALSPALAAEDYAIALPRHAADLRAEIDRALAAMRADGTLARLDARWGLVERDP